MEIHPPDNLVVAASTTPEEFQINLSPSLMAQLVTSLWRLEPKLNKPGTTEARDDLRLARRHLDSAWSTLEEAGVKILDYQNKPYDSGLALQVLAFQPVPGLSGQIVLETLKPTILFQDNLIQKGEVIVGIPASESLDSREEI